VGAFDAELLNRSKFIQYLVFGKKSKWLQQFSRKNRNAVIRQFGLSILDCEFRDAGVGVPVFDLNRSSGAVSTEFDEKLDELHYNRRY